MDGSLKPQLEALDTKARACTADRRGRRAPAPVAAAQQRRRRRKRPAAAAQRTSGSRASRQLHPLHTPPQAHPQIRLLEVSRAEVGSVKAGRVRRGPAQACRRLRLLRRSAH
jgi:hypothetical protein